MSQIRSSLIQMYSVCLTCETFRINVLITNTVCLCLSARPAVDSDSPAEFTCGQTSEWGRDHQTVPGSAHTHTHTHTHTHMNLMFNNMFYWKWTGQRAVVVIIIVIRFLQQLMTRKWWSLFPSMKLLLLQYWIIIYSFLVSLKYCKVFNIWM